jgi:hypothetical protein
VFAQIVESLEPFRIYWKNYGGWRALAKSPYLWAAVFLTAVCFPFWSVNDPFEGRKSAQMAIDVVPSLMAFSLGGMAILLAFSSGRFIDAIREDGNPQSLFMEIVANFFHFLLLQTLALATAFATNAFVEQTWLAGASFFLLAYSLMAALAASAMLLNASRIFNKVGGRKKDEEDDDPTPSQ